MSNKPRRDRQVRARAIKRLKRERGISYTEAVRIMDADRASACSADRPEYMPPKGTSIALNRLPAPVRATVERLIEARVITGCREESPRSWQVCFTNGYHAWISSPDPAGVWYDREATGWWLTQGAHAIWEGYTPNFPSAVGIPAGHCTPDSIAADLETVGAYPPHLGATAWNLVPLEG